MIFDIENLKEWLTDDTIKTIYLLENEQPGYDKYVDGEKAYVNETDTYDVLDRGTIESLHNSLMETEGFQDMCSLTTVYDTPITYTLHTNAEGLVNIIILKKNLDDLIEE